PRHRADRRKLSDRRRPGTVVLFGERAGTGLGRLQQCAALRRLRQTLRRLVAARRRRPEPAATRSGNAVRGALLGLSLLLGGAVLAEVQVFPLRGPNPEQVQETLRSVLGDRAQVDIIQQKLVVVGDPATLREAADVLRKVDKLPASLRLTL